MESLSKTQQTDESHPLRPSKSALFWALNRLALIRFPHHHIPVIIAYSQQGRIHRVPAVIAHFGGSRDRELFSANSIHHSSMKLPVMDSEPIKRSGFFPFSILHKNRGESSTSQEGMGQ